MSGLMARMPAFATDDASDYHQTATTRGIAQGAEIHTGRQHIPGGGDLLCVSQEQAFKE
jgi:hypothetical protein